MGGGSSIVLCEAQKCKGGKGARGEEINNTYYMSQSGIWRDISRAGGHIFTSRRRVKYSLRVKCLAYSTLTSVINCLSYA